MVELISEIGSNWRGTVPQQNTTISARIRENNDPDHLDRALELIAQSKACGFDAVKFQLFKAEEMHRNEEYIENLKYYELPTEWIPVLHRATTALGMEFLCTPFYLDAVDFLDQYVKRWKIASWDLDFLPLLEKVADTKKPVILSTGAATRDEIHVALSILEDNKVTLMHCNGGYPTPSHRAELDRISMLSSKFGWRINGVGYSSHVGDPIITASSVLYGAKIIEVHFDLGDRGGHEHGHSYTPERIRDLKDLINRFEKARKFDETGFNKDDKYARKNYRRDKSDWLRPVK